MGVWNEKGRVMPPEQALAYKITGRDVLAIVKGVEQYVFVFDVMTHKTRQQEAGQ